MSWGKQAEMSRRVNEIKSAQYGVNVGKSDTSAVDITLNLSMHDLPEGLMSKPTLQGDKHHFSQIIQIYMHTWALEIHAEVKDDMKN